MQTPNVCPPAAHSTSARNADNPFSFEKPPCNGEAFGEVMNRALSSRESNRDADDRRANEKTSTAKPKKTVRPEHDQTAATNSSAHNPREIHHQNEKLPAGNSHESSNALAPQDASFGISATASPGATETRVISKEVKATSGSSSESQSTDGLNSKAPKTADKTTSSIQPSADSKTAEAKGPETAAAKSTAADQSDPSAAVDSSADPPDAAAVAETQSCDAENPADSQVKAAIENASASPPALHGTSAAKQDMTMKKTAKTPKVAGPAEQDLPGDAAQGSEELPTGQKLAAKASVHGSEKPAAAPMVESTAATRLSVEPPAATVTATTTAPATSIDTRVLERTHDIVALHAMRLGQSGSDSLHVVVKPGAGIQLSLELRQSETGIEVRAALHKGNFEQLSRHWPELQQRLEARGVRIGTLATAENFSSTSQHQSKQQSADRDSLSAGAFAEFALAGSMTEAPGARAARASAYRGWETWA